MRFRKACQTDLDQIAVIYEHILALESQGGCSTGWIPGVYPTYQTAQAALGREDLFVLELDGSVCGSAIINRLQVDVYEGAPWHYPAKDEQVMVLHTLTISPAASGKGLGKAFVAFYEDYARACQCTCLRMDTNARNTKARAMYKRLGYEEIAVVPCAFNGIPDVNLVLLEKKL